MEGYQKSYCLSCRPPIITFIISIMVSAITSPDQTGAKVYYQSVPDWYQSGPWRRRSSSAVNVHASR